MRAFEQVAAIYSDIRALRSSISLLNWDQQVLMPSGGTQARSQHLLQLAKLEHQLLTSHELSQAVESAFSEATPFEEAQLRNLRYEIQRANKIPSSLIERKAVAASRGYQQWRKSKASNDFQSMVPRYEELFDLAGEMADSLGYKDHRYDALIDLYEEGSTYQEAVQTLGSIKEPTLALLARIKSEGKPVDDSFLVRDWDQPKLKVAMERIIRHIGFSFDTGRLDIAANAFCTNLSPEDVRMTTRPSSHFCGIVSSTLHEMGHGLYEQNQRLDWSMTPLCGGVSLAVHESQSRTWENVVGRSREFWEFFWIWFQEQFQFLKDVNLDNFYRAYNRVSPSLIRVGSDELHYNLHILIRFELEVEIITGRLAVKDLSQAWNEKYREYFGVVPQTDSEGVLQDVHWSRGSVGYFPTYTYGNVLGAQIWEVLRQEVDDVEELMQTGSYRPILDWLVERVYGYGKMMKPKALMEHVLGGPMDSKVWMNYATKKFSDIYELK